VIVIVHGPDASICRVETKRAASDIDPEGSNTSRLDGKSLRITDAISMVATPSFFGSGRVVIIDDFLARSSGANESSDVASDSPTTKGPNFGGEIASLFAAVHPDNLLILVDSSLSSVPAVVAKLLPKEARLVSGEPPRGHTLIEWIRAQASDYGSEIDRDAAQLLAETLYPRTWSAKPSNPRFDRPPDLDYLSNELSKLGLYAHPDTIHLNHVRELVVSALADRLFPFVEQAVAGNLAKAVRDIESIDIHGDDGHRAASQLYQQIELSTVLAVSPPKNDPTAVGRDLGLSNPNRLFGIARAPQPAFPDQTVLVATDADRGLKTGKIKDVADGIYSLMTWFAETRRETTNRRGRS
jgi:DNA polymerase III delta subunit